VPPSFTDQKLCYVDIVRKGIFLFQKFAVLVPLTTEFLADRERREAALAQIPLGRFGTPDDLIGVAVLLASDGGSFITGQTIFVDGGRTLL
jgi:NAD(P)-dependent dehydrogenase (short-subunit alcohol dehydrogenase family)